MKTFNIKIVALSLGLLSQPFYSAHAYVLKNPTDLSATALRNSGATYGPEVVTRLGNDSETTQSRDADIATTTSDDSSNFNNTQNYTYDDLNNTAPIARSIRTDPVSDNDESSRIETTQSAANLENADHASESTVMTNKMDQQAQQVEPTHSSAVGWIVALLVVVGLGGAYSISRKRDPYSTNLRS